MHILHVHVTVKPEFVEQFIEAIRDNAQNSIQEPGVVRFDVHQQQDDPTRFVLVEVYQTPDDHAKHRETAHYLKWRDEVVDMMQEARYALRYNNIYPANDNWV